jgi:prepilin-type N-terminal cleavage/methylation domain-containing protein
MTLRSGAETIPEDGEGGFTLVELMIVILISSLVMGTAYTIFSSHQKVYSNQKGVVNIQQNLRAGMYYISREIRLAGYSRDDTAPDAGILQAMPGVFQFTMDINSSSSSDVDWGDIKSNGDVTGPGENITYNFLPDDDADQDGIADSAPSDLVRTDSNADSGAGAQDILMNNVEAIGFAYAFDNDNDGRPDLSDNENIIWAVDTDGDGQLDTQLDTNDDGNIDTGDDAGGGALGTTVGIGQICMVRIWILARSPVLDNKFHFQSTYVVGINQLTVDDGYRRRLLDTSVMCRNKEA